MGSWTQAARLGPMMALMFVLLACEKPPEPDLKIERRTDFAPEEFGIGRPHTRNAACNREIDRLLDATRLCFNSRPEAECSRLQAKNSRAIARLKGTARCRNP